MVPVISSFLPTCGLSAVGFAMSRYVLFPDAVASLVVVAPVVLGAPLVSAGADTAFVRMNVGASAVVVAAVVPGAPGAPVVPAVPAVPVAPGIPVAVVAADVAGASFRHPVTVIFRSALEVVLCGGVVCGEGAVCAAMAAVAKPTIAVHTPVQIVFVMLPPEAVGLQRSDRNLSSQGSTDANRVIW